MNDPRVLELTEYEPLYLERHELSNDQADLIYEHCRHHVSIDAPGPATGHRWKLVSNGYVGYWPLGDDLALSLKPRVPLGNIFRMMEYAYRFDFEMFDGISQCESLQEFYERLANVLAKRVLDRSRRGFYRTYIPWNKRLPHVRGRVDVERAIRRPWDVTMPCHYEEHTADIAENGILSQTLSVVARSGLCSARTAPTVRKAFRSIAGLAPPRGASVTDCLGRLYNRLNEDYQPMHALCRFFLEHSGPTHEAGDRDMIPFVVHMPGLFEKFVAAWLAAHLPEGLELVPQYAVKIGDAGDVRIVIDMVIRDAEGRAVCVLDTKYKIHEQVQPGDLQQVVAYAVAMDCDRGVLVYPRELENPLDVAWEKVRAASLSFEIGGDIDDGGRIALGQLRAMFGALKY